MGSGAQRQPDSEGCSATAGTVHGDSSTLPFDECPANCQSQTDAGRLHLAGGTSPVEPLEELGNLVLRDPGPGLLTATTAALPSIATPTLTSLPRGENLTALSNTFATTWLTAAGETFTA